MANVGRNPSVQMCWELLGVAGSFSSFCTVAWPGDIQTTLSFSLHLLDTQSKFHVFVGCQATVAQAGLSYLQHLLRDDYCMS